MRGRNHRSTKIFSVVAMIINLYRIAGTGLTVYVIYESFLKAQPLNLFDAGVDEGDLTGNDEEEEDEKGSGSLSWWYDALLPTPFVEVVTCLVLLYMIMGPLSPTIPIKQWMAWFISMRVFWMRLMWTGTAIAFSIVNTLYIKKMYEISNLPKYKDAPSSIAIMAVIAVEYFCLGLLQCAMKIMNFEVIQGKLKKNKQGFSESWMTFMMWTFNICMLAFALRNFSMSFYFGLLSAFVTEKNADDDPQKENPYTSLILVFQIYLSVIRGWFYGFFMKNFLSVFLKEEDDPMFDGAREDEDSRTADNEESNATHLEMKPLKEQESYPK